jgi:CRISPR-associated endonuclease Csn1
MPIISDRRTGEVRDRLPYYAELLFERLGTGSGVVTDTSEKRWGRAPNPTVHVALNEVRRVVNAIIERHGKPAQIVIETLRELGRSAIQRREVERGQKKNQEANERRRSLLREIGLPTNGDNLMRLRLWEEQATDPLKRVCPYTGRLITERMALSDEVEEDHILPFAVTLDDSTANRVLVMREANRQKSRRTPFEAFGHAPQWANIQQHIENLPANKRWRFAPDALQNFAADGDFLARRLADTATMARLARLYLDVLVPGKVWSTPGRLTGLLRSKLGISTEAVLGRGGSFKSRTDHRHHAIDAVVVALTDRALLQSVSTAAGRGGSKGRLLDDLEEPWEGFVRDATTAVARLVVSHKPDSGWQGALHNDTAYGPLKSESKKAANVVVRRPLESLAEWSKEEVSKHVRDTVLASKIASVLETGDKTERRSQLLTLKHSAGKTVRRVRTVERLDNVAPIKHRRTGKAYKLVKLDSNHRVELWQLPNKKYSLVVVSTFDAAQEAARARGAHLPFRDLRPHPAASLLIRLHKNDMVAIGNGTERQIMRVVKMSNGQVTLAPHNEGGNLKARDNAKDDAFRYLSASATKLRELQARKVWVNPAGKVRDPGPAA